MSAIARAGDIVRARAAIRAIVEPLKLQCHGYRVEEQLGRVEGEGWLDDDIVVVVKAAIRPGDGFPREQYRDNQWRFESYEASREAAIEAVHQAVVAKLPWWREKLREDVELATWVGRRVRSCRAGYFGSVLI